MPRKRGPGHPVTTRSASTPPIFYRVSREQYDELTKEGRARKPRLSPNQVAKERASERNHRGMDGCEVCGGARGGVPGNENIVNDKVMCDDCHALASPTPRRDPR
jgi:hypothetical protein